MKYFFKIFIFIFVVSVAFSPFFSSAQVSYKTLETIPGITEGNNYVAGEGSFYLLLNRIFTFGIGLAAALAVVMLAIGGIQYMMSDIPFIKGEGKDKMWNAVGGLILALGIFIFLSTINPDLTNLRLKLTQAPGVSSSPQTTPTTTPVSACPIQPLSAITDPLAQRMESGERVLWENTNPKLRCAANKLIQLSGGGEVTSAYRPQSYQSHLYEVHDRWCVQGLRSNTDPACAALKNTVGAEASNHQIANCGAVAQTNSTHGSGVGVDISGVNSSKAGQACLVWARYPGDDVHYNLNTACTPVCN